MCRSSSTFFYTPPAGSGWIDLLWSCRVFCALCHAFVLCALVTSSQSVIRFGTFHFLRLYILLHYLYGWISGEDMPYISHGDSGHYNYLLLLFLIYMHFDRPQEGLKVTSFPTLKDSSACILPTLGFLVCSWIPSSHIKFTLGLLTFQFCDWTPAPLQNTRHDHTPYLGFYYQFFTMPVSVSSHTFQFSKWFCSRPGYLWPLPLFPFFQLPDLESGLLRPLFSLIPSTYLFYVVLVLGGGHLESGVGDSQRGTPHLCPHETISH